MMKILLIDDDAVDRINAIRNLTSSGLALNVIEADTAKKGLDLATSDQFDVVLLDYSLPDMDGLEVLTLLQGGWIKSTAIIMLSHSSDEGIALKCIEAGAQDFIVKSEVSSVRLKRAILQAQERFKLEHELRVSYQQLRHLAERDTLTGLTNRYFFDETLKKAIPMAKREKKSFALIMLDLDFFKDVNDTLGHLAGDILLQNVATRLQGPLREEDVLSRLGGDEFAILVQNIVHNSDIGQLVDRIFDALRPPLDINGNQLTVTASIGIATYPECATDSNQLLKCADVAMYRSKSSGRNQSHFYSTAIHDEVHKRVNLEKDLRVALEQQQFVLYYQPQVSYAEHQLVGVEALIRWIHPTKGMISPLDFIPVAEEMGLIDEIGRWVIDTACKQLAEWDQLIGHNVKLSMAANVSALQLNFADFYSYVMSILEKYQIPAWQLELELTESTINRSEVADKQLMELSAAGITLALDDFGTGYSSLTHLQRLPFEVVKIDKSFIQNIHDETDSYFLRAICAFSKALNFDIVAEGVETEFQRGLCEALKVDRIQGYYFAKPMPANELTAQWITQFENSPSLES
jgi:diguanylate cyclase